MIVLRSEFLKFAADFYCISRINAVFYYSGLFLSSVIENPLVGTTLMGAINVLATYAALLLMDRCGRRTLIMWSSGGMFLSCVVIVLSLLGYFDKMVALGAVASYVTFFEIGLGPIPVSNSLWKLIGSACAFI
jgi:SP family facilitated glucose transporter-like MFS transporter 3